MNTLVLITAVVLAVVCAATLTAILEKRFPCTCGRMKVWYFPPRHERIGVMVFYAGWHLMLMVGLVLVHSPVAVLGAVLSVYHVRRAWFDERGRKKRRAAKGLGRVFVTEHGTLSVWEK